MSDARTDPKDCGERQVLRVEGAIKRFPLRSPILRRTVGHVEALRGLDLTIHSGQTVALVGESGSGKTTLGRCIIGLDELDGGSISYTLPSGLSWQPRSQVELARQVQCVFQDPATSLSPRMTVGQIVAEPFRVHRGFVPRSEEPARVESALEAVGIPGSWATRHPHQLSGGQRQRVAIARALVLQPQLIVLDEPVSALDVAVQAQILNLLDDLQQSYKLAYLLISHDLGVVRALADYVYVIYLGRIVEHGPPEEILATAHHPYTTALLESDPSHEAWDLAALDVDPPVAAAVENLAGCPYTPRCPFADARCETELPLLRALSETSGRVACHHAPVPASANVTPNRSLPT